MFISYLLNPFTVPVLKISGLKSAHIHPCKQYIGWSCKKSTFITVHFDRNPFTSSRVGEEAVVVSFGTFIGRFLSDGAASMAVKGLNKILCTQNIDKGHFV